MSIEFKSTASTNNMILKDINTFMKKCPDAVSNCQTQNLIKTSLFHKVACLLQHKHRLEVALHYQILLQLF